MYHVTTGQSVARVICYVSKVYSLLTGYWFGAKQFGQVSECCDLTFYGYLLCTLLKTLVMYDYEWFRPVGLIRHVFGKLYGFFVLICGYGHVNW